MRISKFEQRTPEWFADRIGVPSASQFHKIITPTGQASKQVDGYINELVAEKVTQQQAYVHETEAMKRGTELEPMARENFEFITDYSVSEIGFCKHDKLEIGCSPDGVIDLPDGKVAVLEIKCPMANTMVEYLRDGILPPKYKPQVQGQLWITEADHAYFFAFHPADFIPLLIKVERDQDFIQKLSTLSYEMIQKIEKLAKEYKV
jgi:putative phage-type endonuclease